VNDTAAIRTQGLSKLFGDVIAVRDVSLVIPKAVVFGFLGPNGSGKSTTIRMLCGLLTPTSGAIDVLGYQIPRQAEQLKQRVGYMTQRFSLYEDLSVWENLDFMARIHGLPPVRRRDRIEALFERYHLAGLAKRRAGTLSGGQRQRLALAAAIVHEPELVFLDEPTSAVDPESRRDFWEALFDLCAAGMTILVSTHFMDEAERCHELAILNAGSLVAAGAPDALTAAVPAQIVLVECDQPRAAQRVLKSDTRIVGLAQIGRRLRVMVGQDHHDAAQLVTGLLQQAGIASQCSVTKANLEDVFVAVT
jgi:ABC-2 type transport system ATP-binding protein